jgi:hypothetical protein
LAAALAGSTRGGELGEGVAVRGSDCLLDPGSEFRLHRQWFVNRAIDELPETDFAVAAKDRLYRRLNRVRPHKQKLFVRVQQLFIEKRHRIQLP